MRSSDTAQSGAARSGRRLNIAGVTGHLSVRRKLYLSFGCVVALLVSVVGVAFFAMMSLDTAHKRVTNQVLPQVLTADAARSAAGDMHFSQTRYVLVPADYKDYQGDRAVFVADLAAVRRTATADGRADINKISAAFAHVNALDSQLHAAVLAGDTAAAKAIVTGPGNDASDALVAALTAYQTHVAKLSAQATASFNSTRSSSNWLMGGLGAAAVLVALVLAYLISRSLVGGIREMLTAAEGIAEGDVDQRVDLHSSDELGETAAAFRRMIAYLHGMASAAERIAEGDLTVAVTPTSERDALGNAFAAMTTNLREIVGQVDAAATALTSSSQQVATTSEEAGRAVGEIASAINEIADGAGRQVQMVDEARRSAEDTGSAAAQTESIAQEGVQRGRAGQRGHGGAAGLDRRGHPVDPRARRQVGADRRDRRDDHRHRRADQPAGAERGHRGRPRRRAGPRVRGRRRGGAQAGRGVAARRRADRHARRRDPGSDRRRCRGRRGWLEAQHRVRRDGADRA